MFQVVSYDAHHGIKHAVEAVGPTARAAVEAWCAAGCPGVNTNMVQIENERGLVRSLSLRLPDRFAHMDRAAQKAAYAAGLRPWTYPEWFAHCADLGAYGD